MAFHPVVYVVGAELRQLARDVNTLVLGVAFPFLLFPGILWGVSLFKAVVEGWQERLIPVVEVVGSPGLPLPPGVTGGDGPAAAARANWTDDGVVIEYDAGDPVSALAHDRLVGAFDEPWPVQLHDVAPREDALVLVASRVLPLLLVVLSAFASMYPAVEAVIADRERGTVETSLLTAAPRWVFVAGKLVAVSLTTLLSVLATAFSGTITLLHASALLGQSLSIPSSRILAVVPMAVLTALHGAAISFLAAAPTRTFKQAQNTASFAMTVVLGLALAGALPRAELGGLLGWIPVSNSVLVMRGWLLGESPWGWTAVAVSQMVGLTVCAVALGTRWSGTGARP